VAPALSGMALDLATRGAHALTDVGLMPYVLLAMRQM
jgi:hypothetical protein